MVQDYFFKMIYLITVLVCYTLLSVEATNNSFSCKASITNLKNEAVNLTRDCKDMPCISKCCGQNKIVLYEIDNTTLRNEITCANVELFKNTTLALDFSGLTIYQSDIENGIKPSNKTFLQNFTLVQNSVIINDKCGRMWQRRFKGYILENGNFAGLMNINQGTGWHMKDLQSYCVDRTVFKMGNKTKSLIAYYVANQTPVDNSARLYFVGTGLLVSSVFLFLVLVVYWMLPPLRNLSGMLLMAYVTTLLLVYLAKAFYIFYPRMSSKTCANIFSPLLYFSFVSSILWLNIMSFDIWWTFRGMRLSRATNRKGEVAKFRWYALYAWGVAFAMTIVVLIIDKVNFPQWPEMIKPSFDVCLVADTPNLWYLYMPVAILTVANIVLFVMTLYNIWLTGKVLKDFKSNSSKSKNSSSFRLYIKMSLVMGISWAIEVVQSFYKEDVIPTWLYITINLYNTLIGVIIFIFFIFNRNTFVALCKKFNVKTDFKFASGMNSTASSRSFVSRSRSSTNKGSYSKARSTTESDIEIYENEVSTNPTNQNVDQLQQTHF